MKDFDLARPTAPTADLERTAAATPAANRVHDHIEPVYLCLSLWR
jgi:hypothetical protein